MNRHVSPRKQDVQKAAYLLHGRAQLCQDLWPQLGGSIRRSVIYQLPDLSDVEPSGDTDNRSADGYSARKTPIARGSAWN